MPALSLQASRRLTQAAFFALFLLAPVFDLLRFDIHAGHAYFLGMEWHLGLADFFAKRIGVREVGAQIFLKLFLPAFATSLLLVAVAWRWGRIYCGWLCPHFAVVEALNRLFVRAIGRAGVWERKALPGVVPQGRWWIPAVLAAVGTAFVWAVAIVTYVVPPAEVYRGLVTLSLGRLPTLAITLFTMLLALEFLFARHLFCRYGCSVGLFQSLAWMMNRGALVIGFERERAARCADCYAATGPGDAACEVACPMRLHPRVPKQKMFSCTQCGLCIDACATVQETSLLAWVQGTAAREAEARQALFEPPLISRR
jgi:polyferredoxin